MTEYADELIDDAVSPIWATCADCDREIGEAEMCTFDEPHADGFREITLCEKCWIRRAEKSGGDKSV